MQQVTQERDQAAAMLGEQDKDRAVQQDKIDKDYDAKMKALDASWKELLAKLMSEQQAALAGQQEGNNDQVQKIIADQEAKFLQMLSDRQTTDQKMRDDFLLGAAKIEKAAQVQQEAAANKPAPAGRNRRLVPPH